MPKPRTIAVRLTRLTNPPYTSELSSILVNAFSQDALFNVECPDQDSIDAMRRKIEGDIRNVSKETEPHSTASVWDATDTETGQVLGVARWKHAAHAPSKGIQDDRSLSFGSAPELYGSLSAMKKGALMGSQPFHYKPPITALSAYGFIRLSFLTAGF